jgi:hypothetical protein
LRQIKAAAEGVVDDAVRLVVLLDDAQGPTGATGAHVALLAHLTVEELRRSLLESEAANGYGNRHLLIASRRSSAPPGAADATRAAADGLDGPGRLPGDRYRRLLPVEGRAATDEARVVCGACPVAAACLDYAVAEDLEGIWAGTTKGERRAMRRSA